MQNIREASSTFKPGVMRFDASIDTPNLEQFLRRVSPARMPGRLFCIASGKAWTDRNGELHKAQPTDVEFFTTASAAAAYAIRRDRAGYEVWFSPAAYDAVLVEQDRQTIGRNGKPGTGRKNHCVAALSALRHDIDVEPSGMKGSKPCHEDIASARASHAAIIARLGLPPALYVSSGYGLHAYLVMNRDMTPAEFVSASTKIGGRVAAADALLAIDMSRWGDPCGLLRPPFTRNKKFAQPKPVELLP